MASCFGVFCRFSVSFLRVVFVLLISSFFFVNRFSITCCRWSKLRKSWFFLEGPKILLKLQKLVEWQSHGHGVKSHSGLAFPFSSQLSCRWVAKRRWFLSEQKNIKHCSRNLRSNIWICGKLCVTMPVLVKMFTLRYINTTHVLCSTFFRREKKSPTSFNRTLNNVYTRLIGSGTSCATTSMKDGSFQCLH